LLGQNSRGGLARVDASEAIGQIISRVSQADLSGRVRNFDPATIANTNGEVISGVPLVHLSEALDVFHRLSTFRHEMSHVQTDSEGVGGNGRAITISAAVPGQVLRVQHSAEEGPRDIAYNRFFRLDEIHAHQVGIATDTNSARALLAQPETIEQAREILTRNVQMFERQRDFYRLATEALNAAETKMTEPGFVAFSQSHRNWSKTQQFVVTLPNFEGVSYNVTFDVDDRLADFGQSRNNILQQIQAARNDLAGSMDRTLWQIQFNQGLIEISANPKALAELHALPEALSMEASKRHFRKV